MSYEDEIIDLNEGFEDEPVENEFAIDIEGTDVNSKKRKIAETIGSGEQDTSEIEHARKSAKNNLEQANEWFSSFFNPNDNAGSQSDGNVEKVVSNNNPPIANPTSITTAAESRISTKHLASASNTATSTPAPTASPNNTPTKPSAPKIPPVGLPISVMPMVLPASTKDTASNPVLATLVTGVPGSPKQSIRFSITSQGIVVPPTTLPATNNTQQKTAPNTPLVQPIQKPAQSSGTAANKPTNPLIPPPQSNLKNSHVSATSDRVDLLKGELRFRLQDSATALAVVQKALEQKRAELNAGTAAQANTTTTLTPVAVPTSVPTITTPNQTSAPKTAITANRAIAPNGPIPTTNKTTPKAPITVNRASTPTVSRTIAPSAQASSTPNTTTTANRAGSTITPTQSTAVAAQPQLSPTPPKLYSSPPPGRVPTHLPSSNTVPVPKQYPSNTPTASSNVRASPAGLKYSNPPPTSTTMPSPTILKRFFGPRHAPTSTTPSSQQAKQPQPIQPAPARNTSSQPQPQERAKNTPPPSTSYSTAPRPAVVPPQRAISPPQRTTSPTVPVAHPQYHDFQEQYRRLISDQYKPPTISASQPNQTSQVQQAQHASSQPSSHAHYAQSFQAQPASQSYSQQAQYPAQQYQYPSQSQLQPQYSYSSQPNVQTSATSQSNSMRVSVNPTRGTATVHSQTVEEGPATSQSNYYNSFGPQTYLQHYQQQRPYEYSAYPQTSSQYDASSVSSTLPTESTASTTTIAPPQSHQYYNQSTNVEAAAQQSNTAASNSAQAQGQQLSVQGDTTTAASATNSAYSNSSSQAQPLINTAAMQSTNTSTNDQPQPTPIVNNNTQTQPTNTDKVDSTSVNKAADPPISTSVEPTTSELTSNSKSDDDEVIILGTNNKSGKPVRRSVTLPPRRLVPSSASGSRPTSPINSENNNNSNNSTVTSAPQTSTTSVSQPSEVPTSTTVAEPMEVDVVSQSNQPVTSDEVTPVTAQVPEIQLQLPIQSNSGSQVDNSTERDRCKLLSTSKFLRKSGEITSNNNNNPLYIDVPDADQSELNRLRPNTRPRQQIYRTDEYWSYWSAASQSQASQEAGQDEQSERDNASLAHSQDDLGQLTQQYNTEDMQPAPVIEVEQQQQSVQQTSANSLARSSEFGLSNFDVDVQMHVPTNPPTVPRLSVTSNNYTNASTAPATSPRQYVQPNSAGFSNNTAEGNNTNTSSSTSPPRIIGPLDKYFRVSPDKITNTTTAATVPQQQQQYAAASSYNESDVITINDSQEDPSARANINANNYSNNINTSSYNSNTNNISSVNAASNYVNNTVNNNAAHYDYTNNVNSYNVNNNTAGYMNSSVNTNDYTNNSSVNAMNYNVNSNTNYAHDYTNSNYTNTNNYSGVNYNVAASDYMNTNTVNNTAAANYDYTNNASNTNNYNYTNTANTYSVSNNNITMNNNVADNYMNNTVTNSAANNYTNINNTMNNSTVTYTEAYQPPRAKSPDNLRQSHGSEKSKSDGSKSHQKVLMPYIADGPVVLTRIEPAPAWHGGLLWPGLGTIKQQYMELFIPNDPRLQSIPYIAELPKLLMAREMSISDSQTMPTGHYCIQLISPVLDKHSLPKAFWDPNYKAFWTLKMHYNNSLLCIGPKMIERKTILCLYITVQGPTPQQQQPITCTLSAVPADMLNFFRGLNMEHYYHEFQRNGINSLYALCQITKEQMETVINGTDVIAVMAELKKLVAEMIRLSRTNTNTGRTYNEYFHDGSM